METTAFLNPRRIVLGLLPLWYAGFLLIEINQTFLWLGGIAALLVVLLMVVSSLGYPHHLLAGILSPHTHAGLRHHALSRCAKPGRSASDPLAA